MAELVHRHNGDKRMQKQIGCMSSFLHIFDRQQILSRKRIHSSKRLPLFNSVGASPESLSLGESNEFCKELEKLEQSPGKCSKAIESINTVVGYNDQCRSPSVVARLMGLESLTSYNQQTQQMAMTSPELTSSGYSKSRVWRDPVHSKYIDGNNFQVKQPNLSHSHNVERIVRDEGSNLMSECSTTPPQTSENQTALTMDEELEKRLKKRGMDKQINDLNALKQILEVLQLKGLLHSTNSRSNRDSNRNFVYDPNSHSNESSIHLKQWRQLASKVDEHRSVNERLKRDAGAVDHSRLRIPARVATTSPNRIECNLKSCNSIIKRKPLVIEIQKRLITSSNSSIASPIDSPKPTPKKTGSVHHSIPNRSPKQNFVRNIVTDDESSSTLESIVKSPCTTDIERSETEDCRDGKLLLERCGKLLHSIAEMNNATESPPSSAAVLPSPVSVLDSGFDKDESLSPSNSIDFKASPAVNFDEDNWTTHISPTQHDEHKEIEHNEHDEFISNDYDFIYISLRDDPTVFFSIEKQLHDYENTSDVFKSSICHRKLVFDVISEMLDRNRQLPPWKASIRVSQTLVKQIWNEFRKIREMVISSGDGIDLLELINGVLKKEVGIKDWDDYPIETSEVILDVERLIFKDLVSEAIGDFVELSGECVFSRTRRKLVF